MKGKILCLASPKLRFFILIFTLSFTTRFIAFYQSKVVNSDAYFYIKQAKKCAQGKFEKVAVSGYHPLYPCLVAFTSEITDNNYEIAGYIVSLLFSALTILVLYFLIKLFLKYFTNGSGTREDTLYHPFYSNWTALILLFILLHPYIIRISRNIKTEATYGFFFVLSFFMLFLLTSNKKYRLKTRWILSALIGISIGLTYLTRPEGLILLLFAGLLLATWGIQRKKIFQAILSGLTIFLFCAITSSPLIYANSKFYERFTLTQKVSRLQSKEPPQENSRQHTVDSVPEIIEDNSTLSSEQKHKATQTFKYQETTYTLSSIGHFLLKLYKTYLFQYTILFLLGYIILLKDSKSVDAKIILLLFMWLFLFCILLKLRVSMGYISSRHLLTLFYISIPVILKGYAIFWQCLHKIHISNTTRNIIGYSFFLLGILYSLLISLYGFGNRDYVEKKAGLWLKNYTGRSEINFYGLEKVAYYSEANLISQDALGNIDSIIKSKEDVYIGFFVKQPELVKAKEKLKEKEFNFLKQWDAGYANKFLIIYRFPK